MATTNVQSSQPFRLAIIGCGLITQGGHLPAALACHNVVVTALIDPVPERASQVATEYGINPEIATSLEQVKSKIDGAIIATPNHTHRDIAIECLNRGISVLIEKPLANSVQEGRDIVNAAATSGCVAAVGYVSRYRPNVELLADLLSRNYFGRVKRFVHQFGTAGGWSPLSAYILKSSTSGGGVLVVTATHFLDRMLMLWGYPDEMALTYDAEGGPEANCEATFRFNKPEGVIEGCARYSKTTLLPSGLIIETDRGKIIAPDTDAADIHFRPDDTMDLEQIITSRPAAMTDGLNTFAEQVADFVDACVQDRPPRIDCEQGLLSLQLIETLYSNATVTDSDWYKDLKAGTA